MTSKTLEEQFQPVYDDLNAKLLNIEKLTYLGKANTTAVLPELARLVNDCQQSPYAGFLQLDLRGVVELCTRFASVYVHLLTGNMDIKLSSNDVLQLTKQKRFISYVFEISGYGSNSMVMKLLLDKAHEKKYSKLSDNQALLRAMLLGSVAEIEAADLVELSLEESETGALLAIGLLLDRLPATLQGEASRTFLLEEYNPYHALRPLRQFSAILANVWMLCSYSVSDKKHGIKQHINAWFKQLHKAQGVTPKALGSVIQPGNTENKPVMAVVAETFISIHAMYRWYAPIIKRLKSDYYMVLVALPSDVDENSIALFDRYIEVPEDDSNLQVVLNQCTPDIVYFPSVGMRAWGISMANLRWAPLQVMSFGHPATSLSEHMDLAFINTRTYGGPGIVNENMLMLESEIGSLIEAHQNLKLPDPATLSDDFVSIAVPCNVMKINLPFITALKEIERLAERPVRFMFFPNENGVGHLSTQQRLRNYFPNAVVARRTSYENYLALLNQNHFALSPFPFGNATSTIDCMVLGLPVIGLLGAEPHSRSDYDVLAAMELEDYCIATTVENYVMGAVRYVNEPATLQELRNLVASKNFMSRHTSDENDLSEEFCQALKWAHAHLDEVQGPRGVVFESEGRWKV